MPETYATRLAIGIVTPATNTTLEPDCHSLCPDGVTAHTARITLANRRISGDSAYSEHVAAMRAGIAPAIDQVMSCAPQHVIMGVALEAFWGGVEGTKQLQQQLQEQAGVPVSLGSRAMDRALQSIEARRIAVLTPHMPAGDEQVRNWFEEAGYQITAFHGLQCQSPRLIAEVSEQEMHDAVAELDSADAQAIVQVGTNLQFRRLALQLEQQLEKPVLALNAVMLWDALRQHGIDNPMQAAGVLFEHH